MKYEFTQEDAFGFARFMGISAKPHGKELIFDVCPVCRGTTKDKRTFAISLDTGQCKCLRSSCGYTGNMITLAKDFGYQLQNDYVNRYYDLGNRNRSFRKFPEVRKPDPTNRAIEYLKSRGISEDTAKKYHITTHKDHDNVLVFPFYNEKNELKFIKYRNMDYEKGVTNGSKEWCEANCTPILFGMDICDYTKDKTLIITEGQIDSLSVAEAGFQNVVSVPTGMNGFTWIPYCWDWIQNFKEIIVFGDYEKGNITLLKDIKRLLPKHRIRHVDPDAYDGCKDANEILLRYGMDYLEDGKESIRVCIRYAVDVKIPKIISLADVKDINIYAIPKVATGLKKLDQVLCGGIPLGTLTVISGKAGEGKSTLASQIITSALESGLNCFCYSGELPNSVFKFWIDSQLAGQYVQEFNGKYYIPHDVTSKINDWYRDRISIFDNSVTTADEDEIITLSALIEQKVIQGNTQVVLIDNLMTAIDLESLKGSDKYDIQSAFVKKMARLAMAHNIAIILIAHMKKNNNGSSYLYDDISGSADIANLASVILTFQKPKDGAEEQRILRIAKSRLVPVPGDFEITTTFMKSCMRSYENGIDDPAPVFGWNQMDDGFVKLENQDGVPFNESKDE